jgi:hypothetical protein
LAIAPKTPIRSSLAVASQPAKTSGASRGWRSEGASDSSVARDSRMAVRRIRAGLQE